MASESSNTSTRMFAAQGFEKVQKASLAIHAARDLEQLAKVVERQSCLVLQCESATLFRLEGLAGAQRLVCASDSPDSRKGFPVSQGIAGAVARDQVDFFSNDPIDDPNFVASIDAAEGEEIRNIAATPLIASGQFLGVLEARNMNYRDFEAADVCFLHMVGEHGALALARLLHSEEGWQAVRELAQAVGEVLDERFVTLGHAERVRCVAVSLGREMRLLPNELLELELATWLHQFGYLQLRPEAMATRDGNTVEARERVSGRMKRAMLSRMELPKRISRLVEVSLATHLDEAASLLDASLAARILRVADVFDGLVTGQSGTALSFEDAVAALRERAGKDLDSAVVAALAGGSHHQADRRRSPRHVCSVSMEYSIIDEESLSPVGEKVKTETVDLAEGGVRFVCDRELQPRLLLHILIHLPSDTLEGYARVARCAKQESGEGYEAGAYFLGYHRMAEQGTVKWQS